MCFSFFFKSCGGGADEEEEEEGLSFEVSEKCLEMKVDQLGASHSKSLEYIFTLLG